MSKCVWIDQQDYFCHEVQEMPRKVRDAAYRKDHEGDREDDEGDPQSAIKKATFRV